ncbi:hypothetical protein JTB14_013607 [Gonioctena quinquepunctata]|nr:hypothetical protein JTB14_013607 [Gonioctena quinquepunctata]
MFPVPKSDGSRRPVLNLRSLNNFLRPKKFRLISHLKVPNFLQEQDYMLKIHLSQAYFHIPIRSSHRRFLSLVYEEKLYQMTCSPFGLSSAPLVFARVTNWVAILVVIVYQDDFPLADQDPLRLTQNNKTAVALLENLGWMINKEKSVGVPQQEMEYLAGGGEEIAGKNEFCIICHLFGKTTFKALTKRKYSTTRFEAKEEVPIIPISSNGKLLVDPKITRKDNIIHTEQEVIISTDASQEGWGAHLGSKMIKGEWSEKLRLWHINRKELYAAYATIKLNIPNLRGKSVMVQSDNRTVVSHIRNQGGTKFSKLLRLTTALLLMTQRWNIFLSAYHIPEEYNETANNRSRNKSLADWHLSRITQQIFHEWGTPQDDLFATKTSAVVPLLKSKAIAPPYTIRNLQHHLLDAETNLPLAQAKKLESTGWAVHIENWRQEYRNSLEMSWRNSREPDPVDVAEYLAYLDKEKHY